MPLDRNAVNSLATLSDLEARQIHFDSIDEYACALLGFQRTKQISKPARTAWQEGNRDVLLAEVIDRRADIVRGAFLEIYQEYLPLKKLLEGAEVASVCDIGCGQGINNVFLHLDFAPKFTLVDIEHTDNQYHFWADSGSGYASLEAAKTLLKENGVKASDIKAINPTKTKLDLSKNKFDLVTSLYSCGFHYPIDDYLEVFLSTIENNGIVCLDLRKRYLKRGSDALKALQQAADVTEVYEDARSFRLLFRKP